LIGFIPKKSEEVSMFERIPRLLGVGAACALMAGPVLAADITGAGATFPYPVLSKWSTDYSVLNGAKVNYQSIGSGGGIAQIKAGTVDFGASDKPLPPDELAQAGLAQFPIVIGGVVPVVHIEGVAPGQVKLTGRYWPTSSWARSRNGTIRRSPV